METGLIRYPASRRLLPLPQRGEEDLARERRRCPSRGGFFFATKGLPALAAVAREAAVSGAFGKYRPQGTAK
jgi:hypothetical protein